MTDKSHPPTNQTPQPINRSVLEKAIQAQLDANYLQPDAQTRAALAKARQQALSQPQTKRQLAQFFTMPYAPAFALSLCCVLLAGSFLLAPQKNLPQADTEGIAIAAIAENPEELEMMSDPNFYLWLEALETEQGTNNAV